MAPYFLRDEKIEGLYKKILKVCHLYSQKEKDKKYNHNIFAVLESDKEEYFTEVNENVNVDFKEKFADVNNLLKSVNTSKRAYVYNGKNEKIIAYQFIIQKKQLYMNVYCNNINVSCDFTSYFNLCRKAQIFLLKNIPDISLGCITFMLNSSYYSLTDDMSIIKNYKAVNNFSDPRGYYVINIENEKIKMIHYENCGKKLNVIEGESADDLYQQLSITGPICPFHITYLSEELMKAELCLKNNIEYKQDVEMNVLFK